MKKIAPLALALLIICVQILLAPPAAAQATAPGSCDWPITGNPVDGLFATSAGWNNLQPTDQITITGHPCGYETAAHLVSYNNPSAEGLSWTLTDTVRISFWYRSETSTTINFLIQATSGTGLPLYSPLASPSDNQWRFESLCRNLDEIALVEPTQSRIGLMNDSYQITGLSIAIGSNECESTPTPTPENTPTPTSTATSTPIPTATSTPTPTATPIISLDPRGQPRNSLPIGDPNQGGPLPGPAYIPAPNPKVAEITEPLWDYDNLRGMFQMVQTLWVLAQQNLFISAFLTIGVIVMAVVWLVNTVKSTGNNL